MEKRWVWPEPIEQDVRQALEAFDPIQQQILSQHNLNTMADVDAFINVGSSDLFDPFEMRGMELAVERLITARRQGQQILIYGDYDTDGITATALLLKSLRSLGMQVEAHIPDRYEEGYGLHLASLQELHANGAELVVSVDCGIRAVEVADWAQSVGLDLIITDHHEPGTQVPNALAVLNPKRADGTYPFKELAAVGVAYKVAQAINQRLGRKEPTELLDLVALGTVADMVPLISENRVLVVRGLEEINRAPQPGLLALMAGSGIQKGHVAARTISYGLAPRINAAGRLGTPEVALDLLLTEDLLQADALAGELERLNKERRERTRMALEIAKARLAHIDPEAPVAIIADENFEEGIVGLVATRLVEDLHRPAFVGVINQDQIRGSARSIPGVDINDALGECHDLLLRYGGHAAAAGFTLASNQLEAFKARLSAVINQRIQSIEIQPRIEIDAEVQLEDLTLALMAFLDQLEPSGHGNPPTLLGARRVRIGTKRAVGAQGKHLKLLLVSDNASMDAIAFGKGNLVDSLPEWVDVAFYFERNRYMGVESLQINVQEIKPS